MTEQIPWRELRQDIGEVLRLVEAGESFDVTVCGRPVARLSPVIARSGTMPWRAFSAAFNEAAADRDLLGDLQRVLPESTDDIALV